jgi:hypothetical protein
MLRHCHLAVKLIVWGISASVHQLTVVLNVDRDSVKITDDVIKDRPSIDTIDMASEDVQMLDLSLTSNIPPSDISPSHALQTDTAIPCGQLNKISGQLTQNKVSPES